MRSGEMQSVKRTAEPSRHVSNLSAVRFTDYIVHIGADPTDESVDYHHSSANADWARDEFAQSHRNLDRQTRAVPTP